MLRDISLTLTAGERVLLVGPSGSGKSTLLRALAGLVDSVDSGDLSGVVQLDGRAVGSRPGEVGLVLQEPGAGVVAATLARDVAFGLENVGMPRADMPAVVTRALEAVGMSDLPADRPTSQLSGGQAQRLAIAGALALRPEVLLLDEPTAMLDAESAEAVRAAVGSVMQQGITTVIVEHLLGPWVPLVDRVIVLSPEGCLVADGSVKDVLAEQRAWLLELGVWVPNAPVPDALAPPAGALREPRAGHIVSASTLHVGTRAVLEQPIEAKAGSLTALVGPSGGGKSTILHALAGFVSPTQGAVSIAPHRSAPELARTLAWVPQWSSSTVIATSVLDDVLVTTRALGEESPQSLARARALLAAVGLTHLEQADPRTLSGGEQRRLALAAALHHGPPTLLVDEPTIGQDRHTWAALVGLVAAYRGLGGAVVAATHDRHVIDRATTVIAVRPPPRSPAIRRPALVDRCGPLSLLLGALLGIPTGVLSPHWSTTVGVIGLQLLLLVIGLGRRTPTAALRILPGLLAALSVGWSTWWLAGDLDAAWTAALRVLAVVIPAAALIPAIDPDALGDHLAQRLHLPDRPVVAVAAAVHRVQDLGAIWRELSQARRVRGLSATWRHPVELGRHLLALTMGLLIRTLGSAADLAVAMDARGFARAYRRSWWGAASWRWADTALLVAWSLPVAYAIWAR